MSNDHPTANGAAEPPEHAESRNGTERPQGAGTAKGTARGASDSLRMVLVTCGVLCMLVGPTSCYNSISMSVTTATNGGGDGSDAEALLILGVAASVGVPVVMAVIAAFRRDYKAAGCSAALLAWPVVVTAVILLGGSISDG